MDAAKLAALALAFPILAAAAGPGDAQACPGYYDPCGYEDRWEDLTPVDAAKIPSDGVLLLQGNFKGDVAASLPTITLTVTRDGQPLAGAIETTSLHGLLVWRPGDGWEAGATYALTGTIPTSPRRCRPPRTATTLARARAPTPPVRARATRAAAAIPGRAVTRGCSCRLAWSAWPGAEDEGRGDHGPRSSGARSRGPV